MLTRQEMKNILDKYSIGKYKGHRYLDNVMENDVYILKTTKGKFILKELFHVNLQNRGQQLSLIDFLHSNNIPVVKNIKNIRGMEISIICNKRLIIQSFIEGRHMEDYNIFLIKDIAKQIGKMHKIILKSRFGIKLQKAHIYEKRNYELMKKYGLKEILDKTIISLKSLNTEKMKKAKIHGDLSERNLLIKNNKLKAFIDWDDSAYDYLAYEIAIFFAHVCIREKTIYKDKIRAFLKEYQRHIKLTSEEKKATFYLIKYRLFGIINSIIYYQKLRPNKAKKLSKEMIINIRRINKFEELSLEEFMRLF